jgi:hypothetical protein
MPFGAPLLSYSSSLLKGRKIREEEDIDESLLFNRESFDNAVPVTQPSPGLHPSLCSSSRSYKKTTRLLLLKRIGILILFVCTAGLAVNGLYHLLGPFSRWIRGILWSSIESPSSCSCGSSLIEAMARSCRYDTMAAAWLPPHCRDEELTAQFNAAGPGVEGTWTYYANEFGTASMSPEEIALLPANDSQEYFFTTHRWHVLHCSYYWRKMYRMVHGVNGAAKQIEHRFDTDGHLAHCEMMFLKRDKLERIATGSGVSLNADFIVVKED